MKFKNPTNQDLSFIKFKQYRTGLVPAQQEVVLDGVMDLTTEGVTYYESYQSKGLELIKDKADKLIPIKEAETQFYLESIGATPKKDDKPEVKEPSKPVEPPKEEKPEEKPQEPTPQPQEEEAPKKRGGRKKAQPEEEASEPKE
ncbi:hypothetical protein HSE3_gp064 [Bacillus phage vB_BceM-HSE3]|nr:hypothetical protein HSE3_gp064 [Bacillus phage vB_BceM-HSE3]